MYFLFLRGNISLSKFLSLSLSPADENILSTMLYLQALLRYRKQLVPILDKHSACLSSTEGHPCKVLLLLVSM